MTRDWKFRIYKEGELYYPSSENKGAALRLCFGIGKTDFLMTWLIIFSILRPLIQAYS